MKKLISIVVPVYNVRSYLNRCIESILNQTYSNIEVLLVDDGSTDGSGNVCDFYAEKDKRIKVFHTDNYGVLQAKSRGIQEASGELIGFVDADDWIEENMYEKMYIEMQAEDSDICSCSLLLFNETLNSFIYENCVPDCGTYCLEISDNGLYNNMFGADPVASVRLILCDKLFKIDLIKNNYRKVDERLHYFEDITLCTLAIMEAKKVRVIDDALYIYRQRANSLTHSIDSEYLEQVNIFYNSLKGHISAYSDVLKKKFDEYIAHKAICGINYMMGLDLDAKIAYYYPPYAELRNYSRIVIYGAGDVGTSYYTYLMNSHAEQVVGWVDRQFEKLQKQGLNVCSPECLLKMEYDIIVIAVRFEDSAMKIKEALVDMGIEAEKIMWSLPKTILG